MNLTELHRRLLADVLAVGTPYPLALTGGYAVQAHGLVARLSQDLDVATENPEPMAEIAATVRAGLEERGWQVRELKAEPLSARLIVADPDSGEECEVDVLKETLWHPPVQTEYGLVLALEDVVGTKVRALADRGLARDLVDVRAAADRWSRPELEELGRRHARTPSTSPTSRPAWSARSGSTTGSSPPTEWMTRRSRTCAAGRRSGRTTSRNGSWRWTFRKTNDRTERVRLRLRPGGVGRLLREIVTLGPSSVTISRNSLPLP